MGKLIDTAKKSEKAVLAGVYHDNHALDKAEEYLDELEFLAQTAGAVVVKKYLQRLPYANPRSYMGEGKLEEIQAFITQYEIDLLLFDDELSPAQLRNLNKQFKCKILDRSSLILDIFASHARTSQARFQVELAQMQYMLPRLTRMWSHLTRHAGGIGTRGPGETEIETDRRAIRNKIVKLKERLKEIDQQAEIRRKNRENKLRISLVGYTNVGKSTLMNLLCKTDLLAENKLFATLDATVRKLDLESGQVLLSDTVGFIRKLPHQLVECFKSTLDEIRESDILIHVVDMSHPAYEEQIQTVQRTLDEIGIIGKPVVYIFNKVDCVKDRLNELEEPMTETAYIEQLRNSWMAKEKNPVLFISASQPEFAKPVREALNEIIRNIQLTMKKGR